MDFRRRRQRQSESVEAAATFAPGFCDRDTSTSVINIAAPSSR